MTGGTTLRSPAHLHAAGLIAEAALPDVARVADRYAVAITPVMAALVDRHDANDPIARQFVPSAAELIVHPAELADPIGDNDRSPVKGLVHRYPDRVLLKIVGTCPVYCRFCFRREMVGPEAGANLTPAEIDRALAYVRDTPAIWEVILTGGDPFVLSPRRVAEIAGLVAAIPHVRVLRWHTRVPVVAPETVTPALVSALTSTRLATWVGIHCNHARELTPAARAALARLVDAGIPLVSQTVLLKGVNDDTDTLEALMRAFVEARVKPYYLHHPDLAPGTAHFRIPLARGQQLVTELRRRVSGLAMPTYVLDVPGALGKVPAAAAHVRALNGMALVIDRAGKDHVFNDSCTPPDPD
jgi:lysine 2,3-aminomutase